MKSSAGLIRPEPDPARPLLHASEHERLWIALEGRDAGDSARGNATAETQLRALAAEGERQYAVLEDDVLKLPVRNAERGELESRQPVVIRQGVSSQRSRSMGFAREVCCPSCWASPMRIPSGPRM